MTLPDDGEWVLVAPVAVLTEAAPLVAAHARRRPVRLVAAHGQGPDRDQLAALATRAAGILVIGEGRRSPRTSLIGPFVADGARLVPVGWLPSGGRGVGLGRFVEAARRVATREPAARPSVALLAQWQRRYLDLAERMAVHLGRPGAAPVEVVRWTAERITRDDLVTALGTGLGSGVYFGHGRPEGWAAYHGLRAHHLAMSPSEPLGALLSMTCYTASRWGVGASFSERVVLAGGAAAAVGAVAPVEHLENMRWMIGLAAALGSGHRLLGPALAAAAPADRRTRASYRILGDPLADISGTAAGLEAARAVFAPAADFELAGVYGKAG